MFAVLFRHYNEDILMRKWIFNKKQMQPKNKGKNYIQFLKDEKFIEWKLKPTDELQAYWDEYLRLHPEEEEQLLLAESHFKRIKLSSYKLAPDKKREAAMRLKKSLLRHQRNQTLRRVAYVAAACAAVLIISIAYLQRDQSSSVRNQAVSPDYIVGNELEAQDILFTTGNTTTSFQENVDIKIKQGKKAQVKTPLQGEKEIVMAENAMNKLVVPYGKRSKITLPDGTQAWLNSGSILEFPSSFTGNTRMVKLLGEMYIEVAPDKQNVFIVQTSDFSVEVLGTKFNVSSYTDSPSSVVLVEGSVGLTATDTELILSPNEQAVLSDKGTFDKKTVDVTQYTSWKDGYLAFYDTPIPEALKQIERYYNLSFNFGDNVSFDGLTCTGKIILSENLDNVMTTLSLISSTVYKKEGKTIYIYKKSL